MIQGYGDVRAIAAGPPQFSFQAISRGQETILQRANSGEAIAWLAFGLEHIVTQPSGRTWAGASGNHLYIITLEGTKEISDSTP